MSVNGVFLMGDLLNSFSEFRTGETFVQQYDRWPTALSES